MMGCKGRRCASSAAAVTTVSRCAHKFLVCLSGSGHVAACGLQLRNAFPCAERPRLELHCRFKVCCSASTVAAEQRRFAGQPADARLSLQAAQQRCPQQLSGSW